MKSWRAPRGNPERHQRPARLPQSHVTWDLTPGVQLDLPTQVTDPDSKDIDWVWDDMNRKVKQITPDSGTTLYLYDQAGNLTTMIENWSYVAGGIEHTFTYDCMNRLTAADYGAIDCGDDQGPEIQYTYDVVAAGCPGGAQCTNQAGRLALVKTKMFCDPSEGDDTFDQFTYFAYDDSGRVLEEYIEDDGSRLAISVYDWDKNGNNTRIDSRATYTYGGNGNSDRDDLTEVSRYATDLITQGKWLPFGPIDEYRQENTKNGNEIWARFAWDLAYRPEEILYEEDTSGTDLFEIDYGLDYAGRVTERDFSHGTGYLDDAY